MFLTSGRIQLPTVFFSMRGGCVVSVATTLLVGGVSEQHDGISASSTSASLKFLICSMKSKMIHDSVNGDVLARVSYHIRYVVHVAGKLVHYKMSQGIGR
jgi:hypothetical protein